MIAAVLGAFAIVTGAAPLAATMPEAPQAFVHRVYARFESGRAHTPAWNGRAANGLFATPLLTLIRRDQAGAKGEVGALDSDPLCDCQDDTGVRWRTEAHMIGARLAQATATPVTRPGGVQDLGVITLDLVLTPGGWRIADIRSKDMPSLKAFLIQGLATHR